MGKGNKVLVMYDVRGIQKYIFRTPYVKDAIGASAIIENLFEDAMQYAFRTIKGQGTNLTVILDWCDEKGPLRYDDQQDNDFTVLYIGGGNACAVIKNRELAVQINKYMSRYIIDHTYALQLAVAIIEKGDSYDQDYQKLNEEMIRVKAEMAITSPIGALPVMRTEIRTGYPLISEEGSTESLLKKTTGQKIRRNIPKDERILDSLVSERDVDSLIAVVHIDGNNMGLRIRSLIQDIESYDEAVTIMRSISYNISSAYKNTFDRMYVLFNGYSGQAKVFNRKNKDIFLTKILVAADDITYVCNAKIALASVEYFAKEISYLTMNGGRTENDIKKYGFSVCGGISYIRSHFPFHVGYEVAEACCSEAKKRAKLECYMDGSRIGNWVDFQITRNIHARNLKELREKEYITADGENLLLRPYFIPVFALKDEGRFKSLAKSEISFSFFKKAVAYFNLNEKASEEDNIDAKTRAIPRSFVKALRDTYPLGENEMISLLSFMKSRGMTLPFNNSESLYKKLADQKKTALLYDSLEMTDDYLDLEELEGGTAT